MELKNILFSKAHLLSPFTLPQEENKEPVRLSAMKKVASIGLSILIGIVTGGIGGVIAFYVITAAMKSNMLTQPGTEETPLSPKAKKSVRFGPVEFRKFKKDEPPIIVGKTRSEANLLNIAKINPPLNPNNPFIFRRKAPSYPTSVENRRLPPLGNRDTMIVENGVARSIHIFGGERFYMDEEIVKLHPSIREIHLGMDINADFTINNKIVIQQQATRGCTAAAAAMLIYDAGGDVDLNSLINTNLGDTVSIKDLIARAGLTPLVNTLNFELTPDDMLMQLREMLLKNGSAIVKTNNDIGGHVIVIDAISEDLQHIRLRDPCHGWEITVTREGFLRGFNPREIIQLA